MEFLVVWLVCGFICSVIAGARGQSAGWFFMLGLLMGPIGVLVAAVIPANAQKLKKNALQDGLMKKCPMCAELVQVEALLCRYCKSDLGALPTAAIAKANLDRKDIMKKIAVCGCGKKFSYPLTAVGQMGSCPGCNGRVVFI